ncbi:MAG: AmmeMemoRadiSam system protein B [bacterium]|nr:AmmeMemoRadiSam system protein B [bacterium]
MPVRNRLVAVVSAGLIAAGVGAAIGACVILLARRGPESPTMTPGAPSEPEAALPREERVYVSPLAGKWYAADADALRSELQGYLDEADNAGQDEICALLLPHAGYRWSGRIAAEGVRQVLGKQYSRVIVLGPSHQVPMENIASVPDATHYETPLGKVALDVAFMDRLKGYREFRCLPDAHDGEHSVQIEVPLLQMALGEFRLVPIVVGQVDAETARTMGAVLRGLIGPETLVVVSSDFTHYGRGFEYVPFREDVAANLRELDMGAVHAIEAKDADAFGGYVEATGATVCGRCPIMVLLAMVGDEDVTPRLLKYDTSGAMTGDYSHSVSYVSMAFEGRWPNGEPLAMDTTSDAPLSPEDKEALLKLARATVHHYLEHQTVPTADDLGVTITPSMEETMGAFVTIHKNGQLRGCIGEIVPRRPLYKAVMGQALNAAFKDRRFRPVAPEEEPDLHFEISAYADAPRTVASREDIELGRHGIVLEKGGRSALFLPQVAPEQGWDLDETLTRLAQKAGLSADAWREGASFRVFEAIVFSETT